MGEEVPQHQPAWLKDLTDKLSLIPTIQSTVQDNNNRLNDLTRTVEFVSKKLSETNEELESVKKDNAELRLSQEQLKQQVKNLKNEVVNLEAQSRRGNLVFDGFEEGEGETWEKSEEILLNFLNEHMGPVFPDGLTFDRVHRSHQKSREGKPRQIVAKFTFFKQRDLVWKNRFKLKGTNVWTSEDFPKSVKKQEINCFLTILLQKDPPL